jgi:hypothetical protein
MICAKCGGEMHPHVGWKDGVSEEGLMLCGTCFEVWRPEATAEPAAVVAEDESPAEDEPAADAAEPETEDDEAPVTRSRRR